MEKETIIIKNEDGSYNTLRFLFSKWTLKEGWDNPNVFTIAKLRSSGSENSKLQEVGRGLRLPVDEMVIEFLMKSSLLIISLILPRLISRKNLLIKLTGNFHSLLVFQKKNLK